MMKLSLTCKVAIFLFVVMCFAPKAHAQLAVVENQPLSFGTFSFVSMYDVVQITVDTNGNFSSNSNAVILDDPTNGNYTITGGTPGATYSITAEVTTTLEGGGPGTFTMDDITVQPATSSFDGFGDTNISLGGRLTSEGGAVQYQNGEYDSTLTITISY